MIGLVKQVTAGAVFATFWIACGVALHACTAETVAAQNAPNLERAAEMEAAAETMRREAEYEALSVDGKMEGVVYE